MERTIRSRAIVVGATVVAASFATQQSVTLAQQSKNADPARPAPSRDSSLVKSPNDTEPVVIDGIEFESWAAYFSSEYFQTAGKRCGTQFVQLPDEGGLAGGLQADCASNNTSPNGAAIYAPAGTKFRIPVVFNMIISGANGTLTDAQVQNNIIVLNEDFKAIPGTPGSLGANGEIEFFLTDDFPTAAGGLPAGTTGSTTAPGIFRYSGNATWYNDGGTYYNTIARTPANYLNIYSNSAGGNLGYVPTTPPLGGATAIGSLADRVVLLWSAVGDPCPVGGVYCTGRTATHEVGHYLGLFHSFQSCDGANCYTSGDRVCDTDSEQNPVFGCPAPPATCNGLPDPIRNYMDYTDDTCMTNFTGEQVRRMRCILDNWRTSTPYNPATTLPVRVAIFPGNFTGTPNNLAVATNVSSTTLCDADDVLGRSDGAGDTLGAYTGNAFVLAGDEVGYRIVHPGGNLKVKLTGLSTDLDLMLLTAAGTPASTFGVSNQGGTARERIISPSLAAGTYYAVVDTYTVSAHSVYGSNFTIRYSRCLADINDDNLVNVTDLLAVIGAWGGTPPNDADVNGDNLINVTDLLAVIGGWGACP